MHVSIAGMSTRLWLSDIADKACAAEVTRVLWDCDANATENRHNGLAGGNRKCIFPPCSLLTERDSTCRARPGEYLFFSGSAAMAPACAHHPPKRLAHCVHCSSASMRLKSALCHSIGNSDY